MNIQPVKSTDKKEWCRCGLLDNLRITLKEFPIGWVFLNNVQISKKKMHYKKHRILLYDRIVVDG